MIPTIVLIVVYVIVILVGAQQTLRLKKYLVVNKAFSPETAVLVDPQKYLILTTRIPSSAIRQSFNGGYYYDHSAWRTMVTLVAAVVFLSMFSFSVLLVSYF